MVRNQEQAALHDRVIQEFKEKLNRERFDIFVNLGDQHNAGIGDNYPDIIMTEKGTTKVRFILEVETVDSVIISEAENQWKKYANEIKATLYLVIPTISLKKAQELCAQVGINVRFATYDVDNQGILTFNIN